MRLPSAQRLAGVALRWESFLVVLLIIAGTWCATLSPYFLETDTLIGLLKPFVMVGLMALGLSVVVIAGEIDISVASILGVAVTIIATLFQHGVNVWVASLAALGVAMLLGLINGLLVAVAGLPSLTVTLGTLAAYRGLAYVILGGGGATGFPESFTNLALSGIAGTRVTISLVVLIVCVAAFAVLMHKTAFGRYVYIIGSNRESARFSGVPLRRVRVGIFVLSGFMAGLAAIFSVAFFGTARADAGTESLLDVVTVVVLGGVDIFGGAGSMLGVFLALLLVATLRGGMGLANLAGPLQTIFIGVLLLVATTGGNLVHVLRERGRGAPKDEPKQPPLPPVQAPPAQVERAMAPSTGDPAGPSG